MAETLRWRIPDSMRPKRRAFAFDNRAALYGASANDTLSWPPASNAAEADAAITWARLETDFAAAGDDSDDLVDFS